MKYAFEVTVGALILGLGYLLIEQQVNPRYVKYQLQNGEIVQCASLNTYKQGGATLSNCIDKKTYHAQVNVTEVP